MNTWGRSAINHAFRNESDTRRGTFLSFFLSLFLLLLISKYSIESGNVNAVNALIQGFLSVKVLNHF